jgi:hypothetical protein
MNGFKDSKVRIVKLPRNWPGCAVLLLLAVVAQACKDITQVPNDQLVTGSNFGSSVGAEVLRNQAVADFATAYSNQVLFSGLVADEFTITPGAQVYNLPDSRHISAITEQAGSTYPYDGVSRARMEGLQALVYMEQYAPTSRGEISELFSLVGYSELFFVEDMCSGVPTGVLQGTLPVYGPTLSRSALTRLSLQHFDSAVAYANGSDSLRELAQLGRARALLDSNDVVAAAGAVNQVSTAYGYIVGFNNGALPTNTVYQSFNQGAGVLTVSDREGINGLDFISAGDSRVQIDTVSAGVYGPRADNGPAAPIPLATGVEARLIAAEAALRAGNAASWSQGLNTLRAQAISPAIAPLPPDSTTNASQDLQAGVQFRERAFWLFASGHRQGDLRRMVRQYGKAVASVFPTGPYVGGAGNYGSDVTYVPFGETANPQYRGCVDRNP